MPTGLISWTILSILWRLEASRLTMPHFPWIGKLGVGISGFFSLLKHLVFVSKDLRSSIVSSLCAQLRYKLPLEEMEAAIEFLKMREDLGVTCFTLLCGMSCKFRFGLVESNKKEETLKGLLCPGE